MSRDAELAWAAGLFEGEGTWGYQRNNVRAELAMTDFEPVRRFAAIVGVGRLEDRPSRDPRHADQLLWRVTDRAGVERVLELLGPWLCERRRRRGEEILRLQAEVSAATLAARDAACRNGHPRTPENTYVYWHKSKDREARACRICRADEARRRRALRKAGR